MNPVPRISIAKYRPVAAKVRFRVKGELDGPVYQGQRLVTPCKTCGKKT